MAGSISATTAALISAAVGAAGIGTGLYEAHESSDAASAAQAAQKQALLQSQQAQANQANLTKQEAVLGAQGQAQQQTGGSLTDNGTASLTDLLAGYPGFQGGSSGSGTSGGTGTGTGASGTGAAGSGTPDIAAILAALRNVGGSTGINPFGGQTGQISGGNWQPPSAQPQSFQELANPVLG